MCTRVFLLFSIACVLLRSRNSALETMDTVDICKDDVRRQSVLPSTDGAFKIKVGYNDKTDKRCHHTFNSSIGPTLFVLNLEPCSEPRWYQVYIVIYDTSDGNYTYENVCEISSFQNTIYSVTYSYQVGVSLDIPSRKTLSPSYLPNMTVMYKSFGDEEAVFRYLCYECYANSSWTIDSGVCDWPKNCSEADFTTSPPTTPCIIIQSKSELTSIFVSGFIVLIFVFVALHCGGEKTPQRPAHMSGHSTMIQHPALSIGDGYRQGAASGNARPFYPMKGGSMNFV